MAVEGSGFAVEVFESRVSGLSVVASQALQDGTWVGQGHLRARGDRLNRECDLNPNPSTMNPR